MKKLFKNILLTTTAVAGIIVPTTIVAKQSNYVEATETSTLTPFIVPTGIKGHYYEEDPTNNGASINEADMVMPTVMLYFDIEQIYDLGLVSTDLSKTTNLDLWLTSAVELKNNIHVSGSYSFDYITTAESTWTISGTFTEPTIPVAPFLTEDFTFELNSKGEIEEYSISNDAEYLALSLFPTFEAFTGLPVDEGIVSMTSINLVIDEFYYTTKDDQTTHNDILINDIFRVDDPNSDADNFWLHSGNYEDIPLDDNQNVVYEAISPYLNRHIVDGSTEFDITLNGTITPYMKLTVSDFNTTFGGGTAWYVWVVISVGAIAVIGLAWWGIHALRNRRSNKKEETKA